DRDEALVATVTDFLAAALDRGGAVVVIATHAHRLAIASALGSRGAALDELVDAGRYRSLDADETLESFMRDRYVNPGIFLTVSDMISSAARAGRPVYVYGEMVGLLWNDGNIAAALDLESLWNRMARRHRFTLFCGYSRTSLEARGDLASAKGMCDRHS